MLIGNTILGLQRLVEIIKGSKSYRYVQKHSTPSSMSLFEHITLASGYKPSRTRKIRLETSENPVMPFMAWYIDNVHANIANNNLKNKESFAAREAQKKALTDTAIIVR